MRQLMLRRRFDSSSLIDTCELALSGLFESESEHEAFMCQLRDFICSDDTLRQIVDLWHAGNLGYDSEYITTLTREAELFFRHR